jgi:RNA polymerase sigma-70 factor (ECF subfamily)
MALLANTGINMGADWLTTTIVLEELKSSEDGDAWRTFCSHFSPMLVNFGKKLGLSPSYAEDAAQEVIIAFIKAFRDGKYNREKGRLRDWLFGIAGNVIRNLRRRLPRERLVVEDTTGTSFWDMIEDKDAIKHTWNIEWHRMIIQYSLEGARKKFKPNVFNAFELYAILDTPVDEVAKELNISRNTVFVAKHRVLAFMRKLAEDFGNKD